MQGERSGPIYCLNRDGMWVWVECVTARLSMSTAEEVHTETIVADASLNIHWTESLCVCVRVRVRVFVCVCVHVYIKALKHGPFTVAYDNFE